MRVDRPHVQLTMPHMLLPAAHHTWLESCKNVRISALHRDVARVLTEHGIFHNIEHVTEDELFSMDIALPGTHRQNLEFFAPLTSSSFLL